MPVRLKFIDFDQLYIATHNQKFEVNDFDIMNDESRELINTYLLQEYQEDTISTIPSCMCGTTKGNFYIGEVCTKCNTPVLSLLNTEINFVLWIRAPKGVNKLISPFFLYMLMDRYKIGKVSLVTWLMIPDTKFDLKQTVTNEKSRIEFESLMEEYNIKRGYNEFVDRFYDIIDILENHWLPANKRDPHFLGFLKDNDRHIFSTYIPVPNRTIFVGDKTEMGKYYDTNSIQNCIAAVRLMQGIDKGNKKLTVKQKRTAKALIKLAEFYPTYITENFMRKPGLSRQHIASTRTHFSMRCVAVSITEPHNAREVYLPWTASINMLREHIMNKLFKRGFTFRKAVTFINDYMRRYNPLMDEILQEIILDAGGYLPVTVQRNPSLHRGSILFMRVTRIKKDPRDTTVSASILITRPLNLDFDGDELNIMLIYDKRVLDKMHNLDPVLSTLEVSNINKLSDLISYPKTVSSTFANWYKDGIHD